MTGIRWWGVAVLGMLLATAPGRAWTGIDVNPASGKAPAREDGGPAAGPRAHLADPADEIRQAHDRLAGGDRQAAAAHLQQAATLLRGLAAQAPGDVRAALLDAALDLEEQARFVSQGALTSADQLDAARGRAEYVLARYHQWRAVEAWARRSAVETGRELERAIHLVERAAVSAGHRLDDAAVASVHKARAVAEALRARADRATEEIDAALASVAERIRTLGRDIGRRS